MRLTVPYASALVVVLTVRTLGAGVRTEPAFAVPQTRGYSRASLVSSCAATGGVVVSLFLADGRGDELPPRSRRYVQVTLQPVDIASGERTSWNESRGPMARLCSSANRCEAALQGQLEFTDVEPGKWAKGELNLLFVNGVRVQKVFKAVWRPRTGPVSVCE